MTGYQLSLFGVDSVELIQLVDSVKLIIAQIVSVKELPGIGAVLEVFRCTLSPRSWAVRYS